MSDSLQEPWVQRALTHSIPDISLLSQFVNHISICVSSVFVFMFEPLALRFSFDFQSTYNDKYFLRQCFKYSFYCCYCSVTEVVEVVAEQKAGKLMSAACC